ncbi:hypothetical protein JTP67_32685, partial [Streptomyces sp. S12]|nr:hypothetical protein [Streptomyces sp. S12]
DQDVTGLLPGAPARGSADDPGRGTGATPVGTEGGATSAEPEAPPSWKPEPAPAADDPRGPDRDLTGPPPAAP